MNFEFSAEELEVQELARQVAGGRVAEQARRADEERIFDRSLIEELGTTGLIAGQSQPNTVVLVWATSRKHSSTKNSARLIHRSAVFWRYKLDWSLLAFRIGLRSPPRRSGCRSCVALRPSVAIA